MFSACGVRDNVDTSDDGAVGDGTTIDRRPDATEPATTEGGKAEEPTTEGMPDETQTKDEAASDQNSENGSEAEKKTLASDTGTGLNLVLEYTVSDGDNGARRVSVDLYIEHYSLNVTSRGNTNYIRVGDETLYFSTDAISYDGAEKKLTKVASYTFTATTENHTLPIYALWNFNGVYSDKSISAIIIENNIEL